MYAPKDLLKLYVYGYFNGIRSSRKLEKQAVINRKVKVLGTENLLELLVDTKITKLDLI